MALLAYQQAAITGPATTFAAVSASDTMPPDDRGFLWVKNASGTIDSAVVVVPGTSFGQANADVTVSVPITTGERLIGPLVPSLADPTTGLITVTHSQTATVTCALVRI
jgi:hypothetical protein